MLAARCDDWYSLPNRIPIGEIPINLALFSVYLAGGLLGSYKGAVSMVVYIMMGAVGLPVFSNFRGGLSVLAGPTAATF